MPEKRFLFVPALNKAVGSRFLDARVRALGPDAHIFGHTHFSWDATLGGIRYIQPCLAYSSERRNWGHAIAAGEAFPLRGPEGPLLVCDGGAFPPRYQCCWSAFYDRHARRPDLANVLPAFVARRYRRVEGIGEVGWGDGVQPPTDFAPSWSLDPQWNGGGVHPWGRRHLRHWGLVLISASYIRPEVKFFLSSFGYIWGVSCGWLLLTLPLADNPGARGPR